MLTRLAGPAALLVVAPLIVGMGDPPSERVIQPGEMVTISVNGQQRRMRIEPGAPGLVLLTQDYADAAKLKPSGMLGISAIYAVGNERVVARTTVARFGLDATPPEKRRIGWAPRDYAAGVDAVMGPAGLDAPVVRFVLAPPRAGERTTVLKMAPTGWLFGSWFGLRAEVTVGASQVLVRFDPYHRRTVANALAAQRLAVELGGRLDGLATSEEIAFGIERPVRTMRLSRPLGIGPLALSDVGVRTVPDLGGGSVAGIKEVGDPDEVADPEDVVVTAKRRKKSRPGMLTLGADQLGRCSSLVFDKPAKEIRLTCA